MTEFLDACYEAIRKQETSLSETIRAVDDESVRSLGNKRLVVLTGCGDSFAVADYGRWAFLKVGLNSIALSPLAISQIQLDESCVVIGVSASGRSIATINALKTAKSANATALILTDNPEGKATEHADHVLLTQSGVKNHNISPSSVTTTAMVYLLKLVVEHQEQPNSQISRDLHQLKHVGAKMVDWAEEMGKTISEVVGSEGPLYTISDGPNHVAAQIGMMKFNEYSVVHSVAALREDFRHHHVLSIKEGDSAVLVSDSPIEDADGLYFKALTDNLKMRAYHLHTPEDMHLESPLGQTIANSIALQMAAFHHVVKYDGEKPNWKEPNVNAFDIY
ncbi:MAG: SIS domain-containing protein [Candidatus Thorarchaeota archaeon]|jgi:fructoselysine-6-P-deglycase FrlB-like protein